jgi:hypothetical protein
MKKKVTRGADGVRRLVDNNLGHFGETDTDKKVIKINKKIHAKGKKKAIGGIPKKDSTIINTIVHEEMHMKSPRMHERTVRKKTQKVVRSMSAKRKKKLYSKYA